MITTIGNQIKKEMKAKGWSVYKLSQESGINITPIQSILNGSANYTINTLMDVCNALQITSLKIIEK